MTERTPEALGTDRYRWDLSFLADGIDDPRIEGALRVHDEMSADFARTHRGTLAHTLPGALQAYIDMERITCPTDYLTYMRQIDLTDTKMEAALLAAEERLDRATSKTVFFSNEVCDLDPSTIEGLAAQHTIIAHHVPYLARVRRFKEHLLSADVEAALVSLNSAWDMATSDRVNTEVALIRIDMGEGEPLTLNEALHVLQTSTDHERRVKALHLIDQAFAGPFERMSASALSATIAKKRIEDRMRGYAHPMAARNLGNQMSDESVEALHDAVNTRGPEYVRRYYGLVKRILGYTGAMPWSARNAPLGLTSEAVIPFDQALEMVFAGYNSFSPTLEDIVREIVMRKQLDAPALPGKNSGAFCAPIVTPDGEVTSLVLMNYLGSPPDVTTLAHELGHGVHNVLAGQVQGPLQFGYPMTLAETASVFGERVVFEQMREMLRKKGDAKELFTLIMAKLSDVMNTVIRQISFSNFERAAHGVGTVLSPAEFGEIWQNATTPLYGENGDLFAYDDFRRLFSYVPHFHEPFYVLAYAVGELSTCSLYAASSDFQPDVFERMYLDALAAGGTKSGVDLFKPFGLDQDDPNFWARGLALSLDDLLSEAEGLARDLGH